MLKIDSEPEVPDGQPSPIECGDVTSTFHFYTRDCYRGLGGTPESSMMTGVKTKVWSFAVLLVALAAFISPRAARPASFDCTKAAAPVEKAICSGPGLSNLDEYLGRYYEAARVALGDGATCLRDDQRHWIKAARNPCGSDVACLTAAYRKRLATLDGLQPGATQLRNVELPHEPTLAVAIPPESEAPASGNGSEFAIRGHLVWEQKDINNMGYAVRSEDGHAHVIVLDMDIGNSKAHVALRDLIDRNASATFLVRGSKAKDAGFAMDRCRFVYRLPRQG